MAIPNWGEYEMDLRVRVTTPAGVSRELQITSTTFLFLWAPLVVAVPFEGAYYMDGAYWDVAEALVGVMIDEGLLSES